MTAIFVEDATSSAGISDASFDHNYTNAGGGYYDVALDISNNDFTFTTSAPGYYSQMTNYALTGAVVPLSPITGGGGGGGSCF